MLHIAMIHDLQTDEGKRNVVYDDQSGNRILPGYHCVGNPTIGYGRCLNKKGITDNEAMYLLNNDIELVIAHASFYDWFAFLSEIRQRVICNMIFQLGVQGFQEFTHFIDHIANQRWQQAHDAGLDSKWAIQTPSRAIKLMTMLLLNREYAS